MRKFLSFVLVLLMIVPLCMFPASAAYTADLSWYKTNQTEFVINTPQQLLGLATITTLDNLKGKTVKLGADIVFNTGDAADWAETAPANVWTSVNGFAGTFDGQGHTISGLYGKNGMFNSNTANSVIRNFRLVNSYFYVNGMCVGAIAGSGQGTIQKVYTDAIIDCTQYHAGGFVGYATGDITFEDCWFDGKVSVGIRYGAGFVGNCISHQITLRHCLNSGSVISSQTESPSRSDSGGFIGRQDDNGMVFEDCLNVGKITTVYTESNVDDAIGGLFGITFKPDSISVKNCAIATEACAKVGNGYTQELGVPVVPQALLVGYGAALNTPLDFEDHWAIRMDSFPVPACFAEGEIPPLYVLSTPSITGSELKTEGNYGPRWTVSITVPEGFTKDDIQLGALIAPTKIIPAGFELNRASTSFTYRGKDHPVADVTAVKYLESDDNTVVASFVVTDMDQSTSRTGFTCRPYVVFTVKEGEIEVYGQSQEMFFYRDAALALEDSSVSAQKKQEIQKVLAPIQAAIGGEFPVSKDWCTNDVYEQIPALIVEDSTICETLDYGIGNYVTEIDGTMDSDYFAYLELLEDLGFTKFVDNGEKGLGDTVYTATYTKGDLVVTVTDICYLNKIYISAAWDLPLSEHLFDTFSDDVVAGASTELHMKELWWWGNSIIIKLKNGHYIVNDGGTEQELGYLLDYLEEITPGDEKPVIDAWIGSHFHRDHIDNLFQFMDNPQWCDRVYVEGFYVCTPGTISTSQESGVQSEVDRFYYTANLLKTTKGEAPKIYRLQTGQRYYFSDISFDVLLAQEQIDYRTYSGGFNDTSTWVQYNIEGQTVNLGGDAHITCMKFLMNVYDKELLDFDVFFSLHHGSNTWDPFTNHCTFKTVLHPSGTRHAQAETLLPASYRLDQKALANGGDVYYHGQGTTILTFPYVVGSAKCLGPQAEWIYHIGKDRDNFA